MSHDFLVELGTEELPPTALKNLSNAFTQGIESGLKEKKLGFAKITPYATPRRLAVWVEGLDQATPKEEVKVWGPPAKIAFDAEGKPTKAAQAFAKKNGIGVEDLQTANDGQQDKLVHSSTAGGELAETLLGDIVRSSLAKLPIAKRMRWGSSREEFVRPVQWLVMLFGDKVLDESIMGISAGNTSRGHRFHHSGTITIESPASYAAQLYETAHVIADYEERQSLVRKQVEEAAAQLGGQAVIDEDLLDEVTSLVEWPVALAGKFDGEFLAVPAEALISSMKEHQKYFHVVNDKGELLANFITLSNIESRDPAQVIDGNERVIRPRLADAKFFFETDKKTNLEAQRERLKTVTFQAKLGSIYDKTERIEALAKLIADKLGQPSENVVRAAQLCKSDLVSAMVYEFTDMQGIAGYHYALNDGEAEEVALAMSEQYLPRFSGDELASTAAGAIVGLADRLDTITGIFGIGQKPTGSKDPFALRRASLGALRILVEKEYDLDLREPISAAAENFSDLPKRDTVVDDALSYMLDRFKSWYDEAGLVPEIFQTVAAKSLSNPLDINQRVYAVDAFSKLEDAQALAAANKRVSNILAKLDSAPSENINEGLLQEAAEVALNQQLAKVVSGVQPLLDNNQYTEALSQLASLRQSVDTFFDDVMVMADDEAIRNNRLALLSQLRGLFLNVADISHLVVKN